MTAPRLSEVLRAVAGWALLESRSAPSCAHAGLSEIAGLAGRLAARVEADLFAADRPAEAVETLREVVR